MSAASVVVGAVLTFAATDGSQLALTVSTSETATATLSWGELTKHSPKAKRVHHFGPLPAPTGDGLTYSIRTGKGGAFSAHVKAMPKQGLRIAIYGDSRDGEGPHRTLLDAIAKEDPDVVLHTGDVVRRAGVPSEWATYLAAALPVSARIPVVLALGNHELYQPSNMPASERVDALVEAMGQVPPPPDPLARAAKADIATFHVRLGDVLIMALNSNTTMAKDSAQMRFVQAVTKAHEDAPIKIAAMHHGPASSGRHGPHRHAADVISTFERTGVIVSAAGHDHLYERIERGPITYVISGGGGAPLYQRRHLETGSKAFASTYNWTLLTTAKQHLDLRSFTLEGALLDKSQRPIVRKGSQPVVPWSRIWGAVGVLALMILGLVLVLVRGRPVLARDRHA